MKNRKQYNEQSQEQNRLIRLCITLNATIILKINFIQQQQKKNHENFIPKSSIKKKIREKKMFEVKLLNFNCLNLKR